MRMTMGTSCEISDLKSAGETRECQPGVLDAACVAGAGCVDAGCGDVGCVVVGCVVDAGATSFMTRCSWVSLSSSLYGPVMTDSPSFSPALMRVWVSSLAPTVTGVAMALPSTKR